MLHGGRDSIIRRIIHLEDRISNCQRCGSIIRCIRKPSLGKGELEPEILLVLESDNQFSRDLNRMIALRNMVKTGLGLEKVYHTYLVRCQPKACTLREDVGCYSSRKLLDKDHHCLLTGQNCEGISIRPSADNIISCLPFLLEEIAILNPRYILLFGKRVSEFVFKSYNHLEEPALHQAYPYEHHTLFATVDEKLFSLLECKQIKAQL